MRWREIFNVVREYGVKVAHPVGPGDVKITPVILIDQRHRLVRVPILTLPIPEIIGQSAAKPSPHFRAALLMNQRERRLNFLRSFGALHRSAVTTAFIV